MTTMLRAGGGDSERRMKKLTSRLHVDGNRLGIGAPEALMRRICELQRPEQPASACRGFVVLESGKRTACAGLVSAPPQRLFAPSRSAGAWRRIQSPGRPAKKKSDLLTETRPTSTCFEAVAVHDDVVVSCALLRPVCSRRQKQAFNSHLHLHR